MSRMSSWSNCWQRWTRSSRRHAANHRATSSLESLETRLNLSAVLVVETVDAYWLIEEPSSDSLAPASHGDWLYGDDFGGGSWDEGEFADDALEVDLPKAVTPVLSNGQSLDATQASLTNSLLADLWSSEPDFFYEDVLSVKLYNNTTMDALMASDIFDDGGSSDSFNAPSSQASDSFVNSNFGNNGGGLASKTQSMPNNFGDNDESPSDVKASAKTDVSAEDADSHNLYAVAKAEIASWSNRVETESAVLSNSDRVATNDVIASASAISQNITDSTAPLENLSPSDHEDSVLDPAALATIKSVSNLPTTVAARAMTKSESFFAKFPSFGIANGSISMIRFAPGNGMSNASHSAESGNEDSAPDSDHDSLSYSQWASLFGTVGLLGTSLWRNGNNDSRDALPPFRSRADRKRPVVC